MTVKEVVAGPEVAESWSGGPIVGTEGIDELISQLRELRSFTDTRWTHMCVHSFVQNVQHGMETGLGSSKYSCEEVRE